MSGDADAVHSFSPSFETSISDDSCFENPYSHNFSSRTPLELHLSREAECQVPTVDQISALVPNLKSRREILISEMNDIEKILKNTPGCSYIQSSSNISVPNQDPSRMIAAGIFTDDLKYLRLSTPPPSSLHQRYQDDLEIQSPAIPSILSEPFGSAPYGSNRSRTSSQTIAVTDGSIDAETPCIISDIETDWEEAEDGRDYVYHENCKANRDKRLRITQVGQNRAQRLIEEPQKQRLIDLLIVDFYEIFNGAETHLKSCVEGYNPSSHDSAQGSISNDHQKQSNQAGDKRRLGFRRMPPGKEDEEEDEEEDRAPKRPKVLSKSTDERLPGVKFACPYHQHNPRKYGIEEVSCDANYRSCAGPGWTSVARIKEHLYRRHRNPIRCSRCGTIFKTQLSLSHHLRIAVPCEVGPEEPMEGITEETEKKLKSRKKASSDQNEEDRWRAVYKILFPDEEIPSPYYESDSKLAAFEEYSRRETPLVFLRLLESRASTNRLTAEIRSDLVDIVQECRMYIYRSYLQEVMQDARSSDTNTRPSAGPSPLCYDHSQTGNASPGAHAQPQAHVDDSLRYDPADYVPDALESFFQSEFQTALDSGYYESTFGLSGKFQCFCSGPCSCLPSSYFER